MPEKYSSVMQLGRHSSVMLMRDTSSGNLVVQRIVDTKQAETYQTLKDMMEPHIPIIYSIEVVGDGQYEILEEYIQGLTLEEMLQKEGCIPEPTAVVYITQLCDVLENIHKAGLVHRDIKPSNIIITPDNSLYLIDFEIARTHKKEKDSDTEILGTQGYAAPEQFGFYQTGAQADIYSTGVLLNKLLTGKMPQEGVPRGSIAHVIQRCIQMDTARRYKNARILKRALCPYLPKGHPRALNFLRQIPGFRSFTKWKMVIAGIIYAYFLLCIIVALPEIVDIGTLAYFYVTMSVLFYVFVFFFAFDVLQIRSKVKWLEKSRGRWIYPFKCVLFVIAILMVISIIIVWFEEKIMV